MRLPARRIVLSAILILFPVAAITAGNISVYAVDSVGNSLQPAAAHPHDENTKAPSVFEVAPEVNPHAWVDSAIVHHDPAEDSRYTRLTEADYEEVAQMLDVDVAAIKAVVDIETGRRHEGFWAPGKPLINFDLTMYRRFAPRCGVSLSKAKKAHPEIFRRPDARRYGSYQAAQQARLDAACDVDTVSAYQSTFWGMFQIGGFNWRKCGCESVQQFVELMSRSERSQLELFARFIENSGMVDAVRRHNWLQFALKYNGPKARSRGYHKRLAASYKRHSAEKK